jgi:hypothetical protein
VDRTTFSIKSSSEVVLKVPGDGGRSSMMSELGGGDHANPVLPFRSDRRTMGAGGAAHRSSEIRRSSTYNGRARCIRRDHLSAPHGLPMAAASQRFSALADRARLLPGLADDRRLGTAAPRIVSSGSLGSRSEARTRTCHHGLAVDEDNRTWRCSRIRQAQASEREEAAYLGRHTRPSDHQPGRTGQHVGPPGWRAAVSLWRRCPRAWRPVRRSA